MRLAQKLTKRGMVRKGTWSEGFRGAEHSWTCTYDCNSAVAVSAAHEWTMQPRQGGAGRVNRLAKMANPKKCIQCRDSLQLPYSLQALTYKQ
jgi:hypothetical protein